MDRSIVRYNAFCTNPDNGLQLHNKDIKTKIGRDIQIVSLKDIPRTKNQYSWKDSIGHKINFIYNDISGDMVIKGIKDRSLLVQYNGKELYIPIDNLLSPSLGVFLNKKKINYDFIYNIDDVICTKYGKIKILNRKRSDIDNRKTYYTECLTCHSKSWRLEEQLDSKIHKYICAVCANRECKPGFNDITITDPWMIPYFQGGEEEARQYTSKSGIKKYFKCPYCGRISNKEKRICELHEHKLPCICNLSWSYPERFMASVLDQNNINYIYGYSPKWANKKRYDFYLLDYSIIIELDGELGHGFYQPWKTYEQSEKEFEVDALKDKMASENGLFVIRIVFISEYKLEFVNEIKSELPSFLWEKTDWNKAIIEAEQNRKYAMCLEYKNSDKSVSALNKICEKYHCHIATLYKTLQFGHELGWIDYNPKTGKYHNKKED